MARRRARRACGCSNWPPSPAPPTSSRRRTPTGRYAFEPESIEERIAELSAETTLRIYPGCDFHLQFDNIEDAVAHPEKYTINHHGYLLVEFPDVGIFTETDAILGRLLDGGMVPIVTHPERNRELQRRLDDLAGGSRAAATCR